MGVAGKEILVNQRWWDQASEADRTAVLLEELGHALQDHYGDGPSLSGDRGQLFAADLLNLPLSDAQRAAISAENDSVSVLVDGVWVDANAAAYVGKVAADNFVGTSNDDLFSFASGTFSVLGDDSIDGGVGNLNTLAFGSAINFANDDAFENVSNVEKITLANGANLLTLGVNTDAAGITTVVGGAGNDQLWSGSGDNTLTGDAGDDTFAFNSENLDFNDSVAGGAGNDSLAGGNGNDTLIAGAGADTMIGGTGADTITGGAGNDTFIFAVGDSFVHSGLGAGTANFALGVGIIKDFTYNATQQDIIIDSLSNTGLQSINPLGFNATIAADGSVKASQAGANATDAGSKNFCIHGTLTGTTFTYSGTGEDYLMFGASIDAAQANSINNNATTDITTLFSGAQAIILDNAVFA